MNLVMAGVDLRAAGLAFVVARVDLASAGLTFGVAGADLDMPRKTHSAAATRSLSRAPIENLGVLSPLGVLGVSNKPAVKRSPTGSPGQSPSPPRARRP